MMLWSAVLTQPMLLCHVCSLCCYATRGTNVVASIGAKRYAARSTNMRYAATPHAGLPCGMLLRGAQY
eukprot:3686213-Rhodomonas_salina.1